MITDITELCITLGLMYFIFDYWSYEELECRQESQIQNWRRHHFSTIQIWVLVGFSIFKYIFPFFHLVNTAKDLWEWIKISKWHFK